MNSTTISAPTPPGITSDQPILSARNVTLKINLGSRDAVVVDNISFSIAPGEFFALVGESGSGKSVMARAIMRLMPTSLLRIEGDLRLGDTDLVNADAATLRKLRGGRMSMIFQEPMTSLNPLMTVEDQIDEAIRIHRGGSSKERKDKVLSLLADVQFAKPSQVAKMFPHELSGGMRQRAMIAMALANDPSLLIADEPTTALDVTIQQEIMEILVRLRDAYRLSVLFISHDLSLIYRYADTLGVLYGGVMMEQGPTQQVIRSPRHPYTRALLDCVPRARVSGVRQQGIDGSVPRIDDWFPGCRFAPRCARKQPNCEQGGIPMVAVDERQAAKCLYPV
jgi:peptide/nickel transport system ATP-binding protein